MRQYAGADWLEKTWSYRKPRKLTAFARLVADIIGAVWKGIYHLDYGKTLRENFEFDERMVQLILPRTISTYDFSDLTELVILCSAYSVRLEICPHNFNYLKLYFHRRQPPRRNDSVSERHPNIAQVCRRMEIKPSKFYKLPEPEKIDAPAEKAPV